MDAIARFRVVRIDMPGSGRSAGALPGTLTIERLADAVQSICARLDITRAHFVSHSMGNIVCHHVAVAQPRLVRSLAQFGPLLAPTDAARTGIRARSPKARTEGLPGLHEMALALVQGAISADTRQRLPGAAASVRESPMRQ